MITIAEATQNTPEIRLEDANARLTVVGKTFPENAIIFYNEVKNKIEAQAVSNPLFVQFDLDYISSSSVIAILDLIKFLCDKATISVEWGYENGDDDVKEVGEDLQKVLSLSFSFKERIED